MHACVYTGASTGQATGPREINNGLGFISLGSDTHTHVVLITGAYADRHTHTPTRTSGFPMSYLQGGHCRWDPEDIKKTRNRRGETGREMVKVWGGRGNMWKNDSHVNK